MSRNPASPSPARAPVTPSPLTNPATPSPARRTTRSVAAASPPPPKPPPPPLTYASLLPPSPIPPPSLPGRDAQIRHLLRLLGPPDSPTPPLLLHGSPSTGKTTTLLALLRHLRRPFIHTSLRSAHSPRVLYNTLLNKLLLHRSGAYNNYANARRCERGAEFVNLLRDAVGQAVEGIRKAGCGEMVYIVFDNVEVARGWEKGREFLSLLFRIQDLVGMPELGVIYVTCATPDSYFLTVGEVEPVTVYFPDYTVDELNAILMRDRENPKLYASFLSVVLKPFCRITRRFDELSIAFHHLFQKYCEPLSDPDMDPDAGMKRRLFDNLQPHLAASFNEVFRVPTYSTVSEGAPGKKLGTRRLADKDASNILDFHMSVSAKYLLISAFLASRNPATLDTALFDSTGGSNNRKRKRKSSQTSIDKKDDTAQELLLKGPGSFPLERLLAIFQCITSVDEAVLEQVSPEDGFVTESGDNGLMSDVLLQLSTLCNSNFLGKSASCPLEGATRYRSTIDEEMALKVARSVNFPLSKYLYRR